MSLSEDLTYIMRFPMESENWRAIPLLTDLTIDKFTSTVHQHISSDLAPPV